MAIAQFSTDERGSLVALNTEAKESLARMTRTRSEALADAGEKGESIRESSASAIFYEADRVPDSRDKRTVWQKQEQHKSLVESYVALGLTAAEAEIAARVDAD